MTDQEKEFIIDAVYKLDKRIDGINEMMKKANETFKLLCEQFNDLESRVRRLEENHG